MQIASYWYVTNRTDQTIRILNAYINKPRVFGIVMLKEAYTNYFGSYPIHPNSTTELHADFCIVPPIMKSGKDLTVDIVFVDHNGQKRTLRNIIFKSDYRKRPKQTPLATESVFELAHDVEKRVAAVLKDEISRYKHNGRKGGGLGSINASCKGRTIKSIYQDSWTSSKSGQRQEIETDTDNTVVSSDNGDTLVTYFKSLEASANQQLFVDALMSRMHRDKEYYCVSYLIFYVLFRTGNLDVAIETAKSNLIIVPSCLDKLLCRKPKERLLEEHQRYGLSDLLGLINGMLRFEHNSFSDNDLDTLEEYVSGTQEHIFSIREKINSIRALRV